jgi:hypothetical protein
MHFTWSATTVTIFLVLAGLAFFLAWRTGVSILSSKTKDPDHLRKYLFIPLLILIVIIAIIQLLTVFTKP